MNHKYIVTLTEEERQELRALVQKGKTQGYRIKHAQIPVSYTHLDVYKRQSLRREDAARLSYDKADAWRALLRANAAEIAARFNVPVGSFHWCGAFHNEAHHPHVHLVCYADSVQKPALIKEGVVQLRSLLAVSYTHLDVYKRQHFILGKFGLQCGA